MASVVKLHMSLNVYSFLNCSNFNIIATVIVESEPGNVKKSMYIMEKCPSSFKNSALKDMYLIR